MKDNLIFDCIVIREEQGYSSLCINIDIASQGDTIKMAVENLKETVELYIESAVENNLPILKPISYDENPLNTRRSDIVKDFKMKIDLKIKAYAA